LLTAREGWKMHGMEETMEILDFIEREQLQQIQLS